MDGWEERKGERFNYPDGERVWTWKEVCSFILTGFSNSSRSCMASKELVCDVNLLPRLREVAPQLDG